MSVMGCALFLLRIYQYIRWLNTLSKNSNFLCHIDGIPVLSSSNIKMAILVGLNKPKIWINPNLYHSEYKDIIIQHELTHIKNMDNYWLLLAQFIRCIYWWNPLVYLLHRDFTELLELRCDKDCSRQFTQGLYLKQLSQLILDSVKQKPMPVVPAGFVSAVISKNSNIRRLKYLKEKHTMSLFKKLTTALLLVSSISLLTLPISSLKLNANDVASQISSEGISLRFDNIPVKDLASIVAQTLNLEAVIDPSLNTKTVTIEFYDEPLVSLLKTITSQTNIAFTQNNNLLNVKAMTGGIKSNTLTPLKDGAYLDFKFAIEANDGEQKDSMEALVWSHFNKQSSVKLGEKWEVQIALKQVNTNHVFLEMKLFDLSVTSEEQLMAEPRLMVKDNDPAEVEFSDSEGRKIHFFVTPRISK
jgi:hypothetical protein